MSDRTYKSLFSDSMITPAQWLGEYMVGRQAAAKGQDLPRRFWDRKTPGYSAYWEKELRRQIREATTLIKLYSPAAVSKALRTKEGKKVLSLGAPWLDDLCKVEQERLNRQAARLAELEAEADARRPAPRPDLPLSRPAFVPNKSILSKLNELDEGSDGEG